MAEEVATIITAREVTKTRLKAEILSSMREEGAVAEVEEGAEAVEEITKTKTRVGTGCRDRTQPAVARQSTSRSKSKTEGRAVHRE